MKISFMRIIDDIFGAPICMLLAFILKMRRLIISKKEEILPEKINRILCIKMFGAGSLLLMSPLVKGLKLRFPNAKIVLATFDSNLVFAKEVHLFDEFYIFRKKSFVLCFIDFMRHAMHAWRNRIDLSFDLEFFSKSSIILAFIYLSRFRIGFFSRVAYRGDLLTKNVSFNHYRHISEIFFELGRTGIFLDC